jgi:hypothetical protein
MISINDPGREAGQPVWSQEARIAVKGDAEIRSTVFPTDSVANGGDIEIHARDLVLTSGGRIETETRDEGRAGRVELRLAGGLEMNGATIETLARAGAGGSIRIHAVTRVSLVDSAITTQVFTGEGGGGDIQIDPEFVVLNRSSILARADQGNGGNISIRAGHFVQSADSVIDASSRLGISGDVVIDSPVELLADQVIDLPDRALDASDQLRRGCAARSTRAGSLTVSERVVRIGAGGVVGVEGGNGGCTRP